MIEKDISEFWEEKRSKNGYHARCRSCVKEKKEEYIDNNRLKVATSAKIRNDRYRDRRNSLRNEKLKTDLEFALEKRHRGRIWTALSRLKLKKEGRSIDYLGCSYKFLKEYLEALFEPNMNWNNKNLWHIDHIKPCCSFDLTKDEDMRECFHYSNLQPLWKEDNYRKMKQDLKIKL